MASIQLDSVSFAYEDMSASKGGAPAIIKDLSLTVPSGQFLCVIGHSGGGKSTLLRLIAGLSAPTSGQVLINGKPSSGPSMSRSIVFQDYSLFPWMRVRKNVEFGIEQANKELGRGLTKQEISHIATDHLRHVNMLDAQDKYPYQLSGGMQQRVAIARALAMDTEIVLFDEPFGALDVRSRRTLQALVSKLWAESEDRKTAVFVTHDISEAILLADRIVFVANGQITADFMVDLPRPRTPEGMANSPEADAIARRLTALFYESQDSAAAEDGFTDVGLGSGVDAREYDGQEAARLWQEF